MPSEALLLLLIMAIVVMAAYFYTKRRAQHVSAADASPDSDTVRRDQ